MVFNYFFRSCLVGDRGPRQAFITYFYQKFYEACVEAGIKGPWDDGIEDKILKVLHRLNFREVPLPKVILNKRKPKTLTLPATYSSNDERLITS